MSEAEDIFMRLVRSNWRRLHWTARRYAGSQPDANDLVQEVLMRAWRSFAPTDDSTYRRGWLFVIMRNVAIEWHRTEGRRIAMIPVANTELTELATSDPSAPFAEMPQMDEARFRELLDDRLAAALDGLESAHREVIVLSVAGGLNYREIADVLDCPIGTVMSRMARARRALREHLSDFAQSRGWAMEEKP